MTNQPHLDADQWSRIAHTLFGLSALLPKSDNYEPYYNATNWDLDEAYDALRIEGRDTRSEVSQLVAAKSKGGAWPRGKYKAKFWLRARLDQAGAYAKHLSEVSTHSAIASSGHAMDDRATIKWLLWEAWDELLADHWLSEDIQYYAHFHHEEGIPEAFVDYSNWLRRVESGHYIKK